MLAPEPKIIRSHILLVNQKNVWANNGNQLFQSQDDGETFKSIAEYPSLFWKLIRNIKIITRLTRKNFYDLSVNGQEIFAIIAHHIIKKNIDSKIFSSIFKINRGTRPLNLVKTPNNKIYFGEYFNNPSRDEVNVYCSSDNGKTWQIIYKFPSKTIRHIHKIIYDSYRQGLLVLTGDNDNESKILFTKDFRKIDTIISGNQDTRAVSLIPTENGWIVPTDSPLKKNYIQFLDLNGKLTKLQELPGSSFYSARVGNYYFVSTAVEPSKINKSPFATLWGSKDGFDWKLIFEAKKDLWHPKLFQYGNILFPHYEDSSEYLYATGMALKNFDNISYRWLIKDFNL